MATYVLTNSRGESMAVKVNQPKIDYEYVVMDMYGNPLPDIHDFCEIREDTVTLTSDKEDTMEMQPVQQEQEVEVIPFTSLLPSSKPMSVTEFLGEEPSDEEVQQELEELQELADEININYTLTKLEERLSRGSTCYIPHEDARVAMKYSKGRFCALANKYKKTFKVSFSVGSIAAVAAIQSLPAPKAPLSKETNPQEVVSLIERTISNKGTVSLTLEQAEALMSKKDCADALRVLLVDQHKNSNAVQVTLPSGQVQSMRYLFWL